MHLVRLFLLVRTRILGDILAGFQTLPDKFKGVTEGIGKGISNLGEGMGDGLKSLKGGIAGLGKGIASTAKGVTEVQNLWVVNS